VLASFLSLTTSAAKEREDAFRLVEQPFRAPTETEIEKYREFFNTRDLEQSILDRYAYRCDARIYDDRRPEDFVTIHAVDRDAASVRHVLRRTFTDPNDPALLFSVEDAFGMGRGKSIFPIRHDRLLIEDRIYFSNVETEAVPRDEVRITGEDRNFEPVTCSLLPLSNFFSGDVSRRRLSGVFGIEKLKPLQVSVVGSSFIAKHRLTSKSGLSSGSYMFIEFVDELPVVMEMWRIFGDQKRLSYRTATKWKNIEEMSFPVHIQAVQVIEKTTNVVDMDLEWRFGDDIPKRLFDVSDVKSRDAHNW
jgi:hypothetical protein